MSESAPPSPPLPYRARSSQVLLAVGAVLLVCAGAAVASAYGGGPARMLVVLLAGAATWCSMRAGRRRLRSSEETLAGCAAGLAVAASDLGGGSVGTAVTAFLLAPVFLIVAWMAPSTAAWPLAAWVTAQLAVLRALDGVPAGLRTEVFLSVALVGLATSLAARPVVARVALVTTAPWWAAGALTGTATAWSGTGAQRWPAAILVVGAAAGLLAVRLRESLVPLLGPPHLVTVVSGVLAGAATAGALTSLGTPSVVLAGCCGVLVATIVPELLAGRPRQLLAPVAVAAGGTAATLAVGWLAAGARWSALSLLLVLTAVPAALVAWCRSAERHVALPAAVGCLTAASLLALPHGVLPPAAAAVALTVLYAAGMLVGSALDPPARRPTVAAAALAAAAAVTVLVLEGQPTALAAHLTVQGHVTLLWAHRTGSERAAEEPRRTAWRLAAIQLVVAAWIGAASAGVHAVEAYTLPAAAGLLLGAGPRLLRGRSWPAWAPGLLVAAVPSTLLALAHPEGVRPVWVLVAAALTMVAGASTGVLAPLLVGAGTALGLAVGFAFRQVPWPLGAALVVGSVLLAVGTLRERDPVSGFGRRLAELR